MRLSCLCSGKQNQISPHLSSFEDPLLQDRFIVNGKPRGLLVTPSASSGSSFPLSLDLSYIWLLYQAKDPGDAMSSEVRHERSAALTLKLPCF